ncbi:hypothetical protein [Verrucomicrobium sp. 3C]|uniref:hypothetical protein n=1 Tax=Verrucomicrobium sp. 3C TaxID=1134055 RepID=UPI0012DF6807|nr:hypothetical protein [Verrucomicrobium sp. 3C]
MIRGRLSRRISSSGGLRECPEERPKIPEEENGRAGGLGARRPKKKNLALEKGLLAIRIAGVRRHFSQAFSCGMHNALVCFVALGFSSL